MWESIKVHQISNLKIIGTITFETKGMQEKIVTPAKKKRWIINVYFLLVGKTGFEPATPWSQTKCSTKLSHFPITGALEGIRTPDLLVRSQTLYPTELRAQDMLFSYSTYNI